MSVEEKEPHKNVLSDICLLLHNCGDCKECNPLEVLYADILEITQNCFYLELYDSKTNMELLDIAKKHNYNAGFVDCKDGMMIKFWR